VVKLNSTIIIVGVISLMILILLTASISRPIRWIGQLFVKFIIGAIILFFLNQFGGRYGLHVPINVATTAVSGILGIPGIVGLAVIQTWILS